MFASVPLRIGSTLRVAFRLVSPLTGGREERPHAQGLAVGRCGRDRRARPYRHAEPWRTIRTLQSAQGLRAGTRATWRLGRCIAHCDRTDRLCGEFQSKCQPSVDEHATDKPQGSGLHANAYSSSDCDAGSYPASNASADAHSNSAGESDADAGTHVDAGPDLTTSPNSKPYTCANTDADAGPDSDPCPDSNSDAGPNPGASRSWASGARRRQSPG